MRRSLLSGLMLLALPLSALAGGPPVTADDLAALRPSFVPYADQGDWFKSTRTKDPRPALMLVGAEPRMFSLKAYEGHHQCSLPEHSEDLLSRTLLPRLFDLVAVPGTPGEAPELRLFDAAGKLRERIALVEPPEKHDLDHTPIFRALRSALEPKAWERVKEIGPSLIHDFLHYRYIRWEAERWPADRARAERLAELATLVKEREAAIGLVRSLLDQPFRQSYDRD